MCVSAYQSLPLMCDQGQRQVTTCDPVYVWGHTGREGGMCRACTRLQKAGDFFKTWDSVLK